MMCVLMVLLIVLQLLNHFVFISVYGDVVDEVNVDEFYDLYINYKLTSTLQEKDHLEDIQLIEEAVKNLKFRKAAGHDGILTEHVVHSHPAIMNE